MFWLNKFLNMFKLKLFTILSYLWLQKMVVQNKIFSILFWCCYWIRDPRSGIDKIRIRYKNPGSATLALILGPIGALGTSFYSVSSRIRRKFFWRNTKLIRASSYSPQRRWRRRWRAGRARWWIRPGSPRVHSHSWTSRWRATINK